MKCQLVHKDISILLFVTGKSANFKYLNIRNYRIK